MTVLALIGDGFRSLIRRGLKVYYPRIVVEGRERIPTEGAVLFVANHPNSLMDPALIGFAVRRPVHFFAKAPLFDVPVFGSLMQALGMVPAFRGADDKSQVRKNLESLDAGAKFLQRGESVGIFPEGKTHDREGVEQVRSGAARIAWSAVANGAVVKIIPLGLNYERKELFRSSVWVRIGEPLDVGAWLRTHDGDEKKAIRGLTDEIDSRLKQVVVHLNDANWQPILDGLEALLPPLFGEEQDEIAGLRQRKQFADAMNYFFIKDNARAETIAGEIMRHRTQLAAQGLSMDSTVLRFSAGQMAARLAISMFRQIVGFGPALAGVIHHIVPFVIVRGVVRLVKHPGRSTIALNRMLFGLPVYALWYAIVWWWLAANTRVWIAWLWVLLMPFCGVAALHFAWRAQTTGRALWSELRILMQPSLLRRLRSERLHLRSQLQELSKEYKLGAGIATDGHV